MSGRKFVVYGQIAVILQPQIMLKRELNDFRFQVYAYNGTSKNKTSKTKISNYEI